MVTEDDFIIYQHSTEWGKCTIVMERSGLGFGRLYVYEDSPSIAYLDMLSVNEVARGDGIGTKLQEIREQIGRKLGATESMLWVLRKSWMHNWYKRRGYTDYSMKDQTHIWMKKLLT